MSFFISGVFLLKVTSARARMSAAQDAAMSNVFFAAFDGKPAGGGATYWNCDQIWNYIIQVSKCIKRDTHKCSSTPVHISSTQILSIRICFIVTDTFLHYAA